jgi:hypothetical protein
MSVKQTNNKRYFYVRGIFMFNLSGNVSQAFIEVTTGRFAKATVKQASSLFKGAKRGIISTFSRASRRRLFQFFNSIDFEKNGLPLFLHLTYPGEYPEDPLKWKRDLKVFLERLRRSYPDAHGVWRIEPQKRGAPHYHIMLFGHAICKYLSTYPGKLWLSKVWYEVVGSGDKKHLLAGTTVEQIRNFRHAMYYVSKYCAKVEKGGKKEIFDYPIGRYWGVFNRKAFGIESYSFMLTYPALIKLRRLINRYLKSKGQRYRIPVCVTPFHLAPILLRFYRGFSVFAPFNFMVELITYCLFSTA